MMMIGTPVICSWQCLGLSQRLFDGHAYGEICALASKRACLTAGCSSGSALHAAMFARLPSAAAATRSSEDTPTLWLMARIKRRSRLCHIAVTLSNILAAAGATIKLSSRP